MIDWLLCPADGFPGVRFGASPPDFLSIRERETCARLTFPRRRREWLLGRWTAKHLLQWVQPAYRALPLAAITVGNDPDGAPYLSVDGEGRLPLSLSVSHRAGHAFCALTPFPLPAVGADIERVEPRDPAFVRDFFTDGEAQRVWVCSPAQRDTLVTVIWSAKEAVLKVLRHGLRVDTRRVEIRHVAGLEGTDPPLPAGCQPWYEVQVSCALPGAADIVAWWSSHQAHVLTLAASSPTGVSPRAVSHPECERSPLAI